MTSFILRTKLAWDRHSFPDTAPHNTTPQPTLLAHPSTFRILRNDWPYDTTADITHLVIWSKIPIATDKDSGVPTAEATVVIDAFLARVFGEILEMDITMDLVWFRQQSMWRSVDALEHIHVLVRGVEEVWLELLTGQKKSERECERF